MANVVCTTFKPQLLKGEHELVTDVCNIALYTSSATGLADYTVYSTANEASGTGYAAGGIPLQNNVVSTSGTTGYLDFSPDPSWSPVSITARYALIYNTQATTTNSAMFWLDFGTDQTATNGTFTIQLPAPGASALLTVTG
jgi:hypothetical protein|tara:strand:- start:2308 stop:2730 length:423 start_codon:yes stop_codon:yes gene_type:complete